VPSTYCVRDLFAIAKFLLHSTFSEKFDKWLLYVFALIIASEMRKTTHFLFSVSTRVGRSEEIDKWKLSRACNYRTLFFTHAMQTLYQAV